MTRKKKLLLGGGGAALLAAAAAGFALAPERGPGAADLDNNGQITAAEIETAARTKFAEADANKDGKLTGEEMPRHRARGGHGGRGHHGGRGEGGDRPPAAQPGAQPPAAATPGQAQPTAGRPRMDANGDGAVTLPEFYQGFRQRFVRADANRDGIVSVEELEAARPHRGGRD